MARILVVLQNRAEPIGALGRPITDGGHSLDTRLAPEGLPSSLEGYAGLVVMGGSMGVYEAERHPFLGDEIRLLREALATGAPALGVCLGAQLLAAAGGARVYPGPAPEVGWLPVTRLTEDPWLRDWPRRFEPLHWHGDTFDLPEGAVRLASSERYENQAFRLGRALGLQFHVEATTEMAEAWMRDTTAPPAWRVSTDQLARCPEAAARMAPLVTALGEEFARAVATPG